MLKRTRTSLHIAFLLVGASLAVGLWALTSQPAAAGTDLSGVWNASYSLSCTATFAQSGDELSAEVDCGGELAGTLAGTVDSTAGTFTLTGFFGLLQINMEGRVSEDGNAMNGTWSAPPLVPSGSFSATRDDPAPDGAALTGDWTFSIADIFAGSCRVEIEQSGSDLSAVLDCEDRPLGTFEGTFDAATGSITLSGPFEPFAQLDMAGTVSADGRSFSGTWTLAPLGPSGPITATRKEGPAAPTATRSADEEEMPSATRQPATPTATASPGALPSTGSGPNGSSSGSLQWLIASLAAAISGISLIGAVSHARRRPR